MKKERSTCFLALSSLFIYSTTEAAPPEPIINWGEHKYALVEVSQNATAYSKLIVDVKESVDVTVSWNTWGEERVQQSRVLLDGNEVWQGDGNSKEASFKINKGGSYEMQVELCNTNGCTKSKVTPLLVADTDGSHLTPLVPSFEENNYAYLNTSSSVVGAYFVEWSVYGRKFPIDKVPAQNLTHLIYAFVPICGGDGINDSLKQINGSFQALQRACEGTQDFELAIHDPWAAIQMPQKGVSEWSEPYKGNFGQMMALKRAFPDLKIVPSIGGWTLSDPFFLMHNKENRERFISSVKKFLLTWKFFDGIDIDWEYPGGGGANSNLGSDKDGQLYVTLMKELRFMLDQLEEETGRKFELSSAIAVSPNKINVVDYNQAQQYLNNIYLMSYDMYGAWDLQNLGHQSAIHQPNFDVPYNFNVATGVKALLNQGVNPNKVIVGVPMYGRGWSGVHNFEGGQPMTGNATGPIDGTWEQGVLDYRDIAHNHRGGSWVEYYDESAEASYLWNPKTRELISFDNARAVHAKGAFVKRHHLGGLFAWEIDADNGDVLNSIHDSLDHSIIGDQKPTNKKPIANAGENQHVVGPVEVLLDGALSYDPENSKLTYKWMQIGGPEVVINNSSAASATVFLPMVNHETIYEFQLSVLDEQGALSTDVIIITNQLEIENSPPVIEFSKPINVVSGAVFSVSVSAKDPNNDSLTYSWVVSDDIELLSGQGTSELFLKAKYTQEDKEAYAIVLVSDGQLDASAKTSIAISGIKPDNPIDSCSASDPNLEQYPKWEPDKVYNGGDFVAHNNLVWKAKWWTTNDEPTLLNEVWRVSSNIELAWNKNVSYSSGDEVDYDKRRYRAKWWTLGDEPKGSHVWVDIGPANCN